MTFTYLDHTGDVGVDLEAPTLELLFAEAARAFLDTLTDPETVEARGQRQIQVDGEDPAELLVHWLEELLFLWDTEGFLAAEQRLEIRDGVGESLVLRARLSGEGMDLDKHPVKVQIKAITYHDLRVERVEDRWVARVIFDI